ncbi:MAG: DUF2341 domain-containing protein [Methylococcales bacterium]
MNKILVGIKMRGITFIGLMLMLVSSAQASWWNESWTYKKKISLDKVALQQNGIATDSNSLALIRLHTGNFSYFLDIAEAGKDIRFIASDDKTPLKFSIEKFDPINEMALIWVKLPENIAVAEQPVIWMYYGNPSSVDGQDKAGIYTDNRAVVYQFSEPSVEDATAYANNPVESTATNNMGGVVAGAAQFNGGQLIRIADSPSLAMNLEKGWAISAWVRLDEAQAEQVLFQRGGGLLTLELKEQNLFVNVTDSAGQVQTLSSSIPLSIGNWQYIVVTVDTAAITLYLDGVVAGSLPVNLTLAEKLASLSGEMTLGADATGLKGFKGLLDEFSIYNQILSESRIKFAYKMQGLTGSLLIYGDDISEQDSDNDGEPSYIVATLNNVSTDGWVVIGSLAIMLFVSWLVMFIKAVVLTKVRKENKKFIKEFEALDVQQMESLNRKDSEDDEEADESPLMLSLTGGHEKFQGSSLYRIYHTGVEEINHRLPKAVGADVAKTGVIMSSQTIEAIRSSMEAVMVRENQKLNSQMVLLTIAISGGPFLGLLGTVLGVMITFSAIAIQGEVNVNAIAPGVAAALATTVAGLIVAIPALFGYNYLGSRIKETSADMYVFVDEFVAKLAERYS